MSDRPRWNTTHAPSAQQRTTGNDTSAQAARSLSPASRMSDEDWILEYVAGRGDSRIEYHTVEGVTGAPQQVAVCIGGATREEIIDAYGGNKVQTITARCADLVNGNPSKSIKPRLACHGETHRRRTKSGRWAEVLVLARYVDAARREDTSAQTSLPL